METHDTLWQAFQERCNLTDIQCDQFKTYYAMLIEANSQFNLTAITDLASVIFYHFEDSLALGKLIDVSECRMLVDVGSGAGFPGIPLKIKYPNLPLLLLEVNLKKIDFLQAVIRALDLKKIECCSLDWRTFLRTTDYPVDIVCARASLQPEELTRMFKPSSPYHHAQLIYWATKSWRPSPAVEKYITTSFPYTVGHKLRMLTCMELQP